MSLEKTISEICQMGFSRSQVVAVVQQMQARGETLDFNAIIDKLVPRGGY
jgi:hypothetical protein